MQLARIYEERLQDYRARGAAVRRGAGDLAVHAGSRRLHRPQRAARAGWRAVRRLRLLHAIHDFLPRHRAGSEIYAFELCRELARRHDVFLVCAEYDSDRASRHDPLARVRGAAGHRDRQQLGVRSVRGQLRLAADHVATRPRARGDPSRHPARPQPAEPVVRPAAAGPGARHRRRRQRCTTTRWCAPPAGSASTSPNRTSARPSTPDRCSRCFAVTPFRAQMAAAAIARERPVAVVLCGGADERAPGAAGAGRRRRPAHADVARDGRRHLGRGWTVRATCSPRSICFVAPSAALGDRVPGLGLDPQRARGVRLRVRGSARVRTSAPCRSRPLRLRRQPGLAQGRARADRGGTPPPRLIRDRRARRSRTSGRNTTPGLVREAAGLAGAFRRPRSIAQDDPARVTVGIDVLVVPSLWLENSPLVIHEAFMHGVAVVGSRLGGIPGLIDDGVSADSLYERHRPRRWPPRCSDSSTTGVWPRAWPARAPAVKSIEAGRA